MKPATQPPPPSGQAEPRPIRRGEWMEVRCVHCSHHFVDIEVVDGYARVRKYSCSKCGKYNPPRMIQARKAA